MLPNEPVFLPYYPHWVCQWYTQARHVWSFVEPQPHCFSHGRKTVIFRTNEKWNRWLLRRFTVPWSREINLTSCRQNQYRPLHHLIELKLKRSLYYYKGTDKLNALKCIKASHWVPSGYPCLQCKKSITPRYLPSTYYTYYQYAD